MAQPPYQEPIEKKDLDLTKKLSAQDARLPNGKGSVLREKENIPAAASENKNAEIPVVEKPVVEAAPAIEKIPSLESEHAVEAKPEQVSEKIETARKTIQTQKPTAHAAIHEDAKVVAEIQEYEKKVEKLVELALQKGPEHAIKVAEHMNAEDNYTLDELHDKMIVDDLRKQLIQKGLLKEL
jgi:hypothetical protein